MGPKDVCGAVARGLGSVAPWAVASDPGGWLLGRVLGRTSLELKPVEPAPVPRAAAPAEPVANPGARVAAYFDAPAPPARAPAARAQEAAPAPVLKVVPAQDKIPSLEEEMASLLGRSTGKT